MPRRRECPRAIRGPPRQGVPLLPLLPLPPLPPWSEGGRARRLTGLTGPEVHSPRAWSAKVQTRQTRHSRGRPGPGHPIPCRSRNAACRARAAGPAPARTRSACRAPRSSAWHHSDQAANSSRRPDVEVRAGQAPLLDEPAERVGLAAACVGGLGRPARGRRGRARASPRTRRPGSASTASARARAGRPAPRPARSSGIMTSHGMSRTRRQMPSSVPLITGLWLVSITNVWLAGRTTRSPPASAGP